MLSLQAGYLKLNTNEQYDYGTQHSVPTACKCCCVQCNCYKRQKHTIVYGPRASNNGYQDNKHLVQNKYNPTLLHVCGKQMATICKRLYS